MSDRGHLLGLGAFSRQRPRGGDESGERAGASRGRGSIGIAIFLILELSHPILA